MSFLVPGFLGFVALVAAPIAIHLWGRSRAPERSFAALSLLTGTRRDVDRRTRLRNRLLLAVRILAIASVPILLAKPYLLRSVDVPAGADEPQSAVLVMDDTLSMRASHRGTSTMAHARRAAADLVRALPTGSELALVTLSRGSVPPVAALLADRPRLVHAIEALEATARVGDLASALSSAEQILERATLPAHRIYLFSDVAAHELPGDLSPRDAPVTVIDANGDAPRDNHAVTGLEVRASGPPSSRTLHIAATVSNFGAAPVSALEVTLSLDGAVVSSGLVDLLPGGSATKRFSHTLPPLAEGVSLHEVKIATSADRLPDDDVRVARLDLRAGIRVLIVDGDPRPTRREDEVFYVQTALRPGPESGIEVTVVTPDRLPTVALAGYDVVFLCNTNAVPPGLDKYVLEGGGLFVALGDHVIPEELTKRLGQLLPRRLVGVRTVGAARSAPRAGETIPLGRGEHIARFDRQHPLFAVFGGASEDEGLRAATFHRFGLLEPAAAHEQDRPDAHSPRTLASLDSGAPLFVESARGQGRVLTYLSTLDRDWSDLAIQSGFVPLLQEAARYLARTPTSIARTTLGPGEPASLGKSAALAGVTRVHVQSPDGTHATLDPAAHDELLFADTQAPGLYRVESEDARGVRTSRPELSFVIVPDPRESDLRRAPPEAVARLEATSKRDDSRHATTRRADLWPTLGASLLVLLALEALLFSRRT